MESDEQWYCWWWQWKDDDQVKLLAFYLRTLMLVEFCVWMVAGHRHDDGCCGVEWIREETAMAKLWDEGSKELPTNRRGIALFYLLIKRLLTGLVRYPRFRDSSIQTQRCGGVVDDDRWVRSLVTAAGLGLVQFENRCNTIQPIPPLEDSDIWKDVMIHYIDEY